MEEFDESSRLQGQVRRLLLQVNPACAFLPTAKMEAPIKALSTEDIDEIRRSFHEDGFVVVRNLLQLELLKDLCSYADSFFDQIFQAMHSYGHTEFPTHCRHGHEGNDAGSGGGDDCDSGEREYSMKLGVKNGFREIVHRSPGRYEISLQYSDPPGTAEPQATLDSITKSLVGIAADLLLASLEDTEGDLNSGGGGASSSEEEGCYACNVSLVVSTPGATEQSWHADGGHVNLHKHLPCHCLNVFVPLTNVTTENGPTEFRPGTHFHTRKLVPMMLAAKARKTLRPPVAPTLKLGDVLLFDYRVLHRGKSNSSLDNRTFLVVTVAKAWFKDVLNFPLKSLYDENTEGD